MINKYFRLVLTDKDSFLSEESFGKTITKLTALELVNRWNSQNHSCNNQGIRYIYWI